MTKQAFCCSTDQGGGKRRGDNLALRLRHAFPSAVRSYQALTFYPALAYGVDNNRIGSANFVGVNNRGLSGIVYRIKVACGRGKQSRHSAWDGRFGKIADPKFHARKIKRQRPTSNDKSSAGNFKLRYRQSVEHGGRAWLVTQGCGILNHRLGASMGVMQMMMLHKNKIEAARRQLGTALALYLKDQGPVSVHCLAGGGCELIEYYAQKGSGEPFTSHILKT
jgi:hypothetical protein